MAESLLILSWNAKGGGRAKALLSLANTCAAELDVTVALGGDWGLDRLADHHGIEPDVAVHRTDFREDKTTATAAAIDAADPDAILSWDTILNTVLRPYDRPTIGYLRTQAARGLDEYWSPTRACADRHEQETRAYEDKPVRALNPFWYLDPPDDLPGWDERPIDVMYHGRKQKRSTEALGGLNVLVANRFDWSTLTRHFQRTKVFLFDAMHRFEPTPLMPAEAVAYGCVPCVWTESGVGAMWPEFAYDSPIDHVSDLLDREPEPPDPPEPGRPVEWVRELLA